MCPTIIAWHLEANIIFRADTWFKIFAGQTDFEENGAQLTQEFQWHPFPALLICVTIRRNTANHHKPPQPTTNHPSLGTNLNM